MRALRATLYRVRGLFRRARVEREMNEELRAHLEELVERNLAAGMSLGGARQAALRVFGGVEQIKERARDQRRSAWVEDIARDLRYAARRLRKTPGFTTIALLTLALGIGVNTSMFSLLNATLFQTPYPDDARLVLVYRTSPQSQSWPQSPANFLDLAAQNSVFERISAVNWTSLNLAEPGRPAEQLRTLSVGADFFPLLGVPPALGRWFTDDEDRPGNSVLLISHATWRQHFGGAPDVLGREVRADGRTLTIIGVMPARFDYPMAWGHIDAWRPIAFSDRTRQLRDHNYLSTVARLRPGVSLREAQIELDTIAARLAADHPQNNAQNGLRLVHLNRTEDFGGGIRSKLTWLVAGLAGVVLLIASANLANLQFARHAARVREQAIRIALGASRTRLVRGVLAESLLLSLAGGALGLLVALWCNEALGRHFLVHSRDGLALPLDGRVLAFAFLVSAATGIAFGLLPGWFSSRVDVHEALKQGGRASSGTRSTNRLRHGLIVAEVALALILLAGAGFFVRGIQRFLHHDPGWRVGGLVTGYINLKGKALSAPEQRRAFYDRLHEKLAALHGVEHAAFASGLPVRGFGNSTYFLVEGRARPAPGTEPLMNETAVSPDYFDALGLPLIVGRRFTASDRADAPAVAIINETLARTFWPGENPVGKRIGGADDLGAGEEIFDVEGGDAKGRGHGGRG